MGTEFNNRNYPTIPWPVHALKVTSSVQGRFSGIDVRHFHVRFSIYHRFPEGTGEGSSGLTWRRHSGQLSVSGTYQYHGPQHPTGVRPLTDTQVAAKPQSW